MFQRGAKMNRTTAFMFVCAVTVLLIAISGCTVILPESQNAPDNATKQVGSSGNVTFSVKAHGEQQRVSVSQLVSYSAKQGYKLTVYEVNVTNLDGARQLGNTTFFTLFANDEVVYQVVLNTLSPRVTSQGETVSGKLFLRHHSRESLLSCVTTTETVMLPSA